MPISTQQIQADFDRLAQLDTGRWDHNRHYHSFLMQFLPQRREVALEVGCGTGGFARELAQRFERVTAIDLSPGMLRRAQELSTAYSNIKYRQMEVSTWDLPPDAFDCIAAIAVLHHLPLAASLKKLAVALRPGGVLLVLDLLEPQTLTDWVWNACAVPWNFVQTLRRTGRLRPPVKVREAWAEHGQRDMYATLPEVRSLSERVLPGNQLRRHLFWRYSLVWRKPVVPPDPPLEGTAGGAYF